MLFGRQTFARLAVVAEALLITSCYPSAEAPPKNEATSLPRNLPRLPVTPTSMDRAGLLMAGAKAASAAALGQDDKELQRQLDGTRFEFRIRFGCPGGGETDGLKRTPFDVSFDAEERTLRIRATPEIDMEGPAGTSGAGDQTVEAIEGFWVSEPWLFRAGCTVDAEMPGKECKGRASEAADETVKAADDDVALTETGVPTPPYPAIGIAQFFTKSDPRTIRRNGRAYEVTKVLEDKQPSAKGYDLVLAGRLRSLPEGRVISCKPRGRQLPPQCLISVLLDRVWIEDPTDNGLVAEWS